MPHSRQELPRRCSLVTSFAPVKPHHLCVRFCPNLRRYSQVK